MALADAIERGREHEARSYLSQVPEGLDRDVAQAEVAIWFGALPELRRATRALRMRALNAPEPADSARCWLALAHVLTATDSEGSGPVAEDAYSRCVRDLPERAGEAATLAALLGDRPPPEEAPSDAIHAPVLAAAARLAHAEAEVAGARAADLVAVLAAVPAAVISHARRWATLAERAAGLDRVTEHAGLAVVLDTLQASVAVGWSPPVDFARSRRRFDLLLAIALRPGMAREELFASVWGHPWLGASSRNALHAAVSRTRKAVPELELRADADGRYALAHDPTMYLRGPAPSRQVHVGVGLVGRSSELELVREALRPGRWVALWGPPGSGKSRLGEEVARAWGGRVVRVELRGATRVAEVVEAVARRLSCVDEELRRALLSRPDTLVVLDDVDDLDQGELGDLLARWRRGDGVRVLTTHRLRLGADMSVRVAPLSPDDGAALLQLAVEDADPRRVRLLAERLDGLPLALELAGRHLQGLAVDDLVDVLPDALTEDTGPLGVEIARSWAALTSAGRSALSRLAAVDAPLPRPAAEAVVAPLGPDVLAELVAAALVEERSGAVALLRAVRRFAARRLDADGRSTAVSALLQWAQALPDEALGGALDAIAATHRAACAVQPAGAVALALALSERLRPCAPPALALALVEATLAVAPPTPALRTAHAACLVAAGRADEAATALGAVEPTPLLRARLALEAGTVAPLDEAVAASSGAHLQEALVLRGLHLDRRADLERAVGVAAELGPAAVARAGADLGRFEARAGNLAAAADALARAADALEVLHQRRAAHDALNDLAVAQHRLDQLDRAEATAARARTLADELCLPVRAGQGQLAALALDRGDLELALRRAYAGGSGAIAAGAHLELGQLDAARALVEADRSARGRLARALLAARAGQVRAAEADLEAADLRIRRAEPDALRPAALCAVWGALRHGLGGGRAAELVRRARARLGAEDRSDAHIVEAAEHVVLGAPLRDPAPPSHLARAVLRWARPPRVVELAAALRSERAVAALAISLRGAAAPDALLDRAHALAVIDAESSAVVAARAAVAPPQTRAAEALALAALHGEGGDLPERDGALYAAARVLRAPDDAVADALDAARQACRGPLAEAWLRIALQGRGLERRKRGRRTAVLDPDGFGIHLPGAALDLRRAHRRFALLWALATAPAPMSREALFARVWGRPLQGDEDATALQATVSRTRGLLPEGTGLVALSRGAYGLEPTWAAFVPVGAPRAGAPLAPLGRDREAAALRSALRRGPVVLTGPPGCGATHLARSVADGWPAGSVYVDLRGGLGAVAARLGVPEAGVARAVGQRLLVLDHADGLEALPWPTVAALVVRGSELEGLPSVTLGPLAPRDAASMAKELGLPDPGGPVLPLELRAAPLSSLRPSARRLLARLLAVPGGAPTGLARRLGGADLLATLADLETLQRARLVQRRGRLLCAEDALRHQVQPEAVADLATSWRRSLRPPPRPDLEAQLEAARAEGAEALERANVALRRVVASCGDHRALRGRALLALAWVAARACRPDPGVELELSGLVATGAPPELAAGHRLYAGARALWCGELRRAAQALGDAARAAQHIGAADLEERAWTELAETRLRQGLPEACVRALDRAAGVGEALAARRLAVASGVALDLGRPAPVPDGDDPLLALRRGQLAELEGRDPAPHYGVAAERLARCDRRWLPVAAALHARAAPAEAPGLLRRAREVLAPDDLGSSAALALAAAAIDGSTETARRALRRPGHDDATTFPWDLVRFLCVPTPWVARYG